MSSYVQELVPGKVFEGTITEIKNGQVTIGLSDGQTITAKMESQVNLEKGQPMLFEVRSNNGEQIAIHPVTLESAQNPTLLKALEAAGLKINEQNLS
ncbi:MAG: flagellar hook-length control protein FliK, partial [Lachnospiraceae bacterium]